MRTSPSGSRPAAAVHVDRHGARARRVTILHPPLPGVLARLPLDPRAYGWTLWPAIGLLPPTVREAVRAAVGLARARWSRTGSSRAGAAWNPLLPAAFRQMPQALAADRRVGQ